VFGWGRWAARRGNKWAIRPGEFASSSKEESCGGGCWEGVLEVEGLCNVVVRTVVQCFLYRWCVVAWVWGYGTPVPEREAIDGLGLGVPSLLLFPVTKPPSIPLTPPPVPGCPSPRSPLNPLLGSYLASVTMPAVDVGSMRRL